MWERPRCNNCSSRKYRTFLKDITLWEYPGLFKIVECTKCKLKYLSPRPKKKFIGKYYLEDYWGRNLMDFEYKNIQLEKEREKLYKNIYKNILQVRKKGSIFDIGAGTGIFLTKFKDLGWDVDGIELSREAVKYSRKVNNIKLKTGDFNDMKLNRKSYDVVTLNSSLEHTYNPKKALARVYSLLKKDGMVVVTVPNIDSLGAKLFKRKWLPLHPPKHLYHFSEKTLKNMLKNCSFEIKRVSHWYFQHGYYGIFESIRYMLSPKFEMKKGGGLIEKKEDVFLKDIKRNPFKKEVGKLAASVVAFVITVFGGASKHGETVTIYAKKK